MTVRIVPNLEKRSRILSFHSRLGFKSGRGQRRGDLALARCGALDNRAEQMSLTRAAGAASPDKGRGNLGRIKCGSGSGSLRFGRDDEKKRTRDLFPDQPLLTGRQAASSLSLGAGVTPAQGSVKPKVVSHSIK